MKHTLHLSILPVVCILLAGSSGLAEHPYLFLEYEDADSCMLCHWSPMGSTRAVDVQEIMSSSHWTWEKTDPFTGAEVGKLNVINNYCVAVPSNEPRCTSCHIGVGWKDETFDFSDSSQIDCLICHDGTGTYKKVPTGAGVPVAGLDYKEIFRNLQKPDRNNCGVCHFYGGGGDAVKHGDLDSSMANPPRWLDVHMGSAETGGLNMDCTACHVPEGGMHTIIGTRYSKPHNDAATCVGCHEAMLPAGRSIHEGSYMLDQHTERVACQTCHIPAFARGGLKTKMHWDWSTAGRKDASGNPIATENYNTKKGSFAWEADVLPAYAWSNGRVHYVTLDDTFAADDMVTINQLEGGRADPDSLIFPVKHFTGIQPYDAVKGNLVIPNLFPNPSPAEDPGAYWKSYDWQQAISSGMANIGREFSGDVGWIASEMYWIQNHMVAPREYALRCIDCHTTYGQLDFSELGYRRTHAESLQKLYQYLVWAGYAIEDYVWVDTFDWLGTVHIGNEPWVFPTGLRKYLYMPEPAIDRSGGWSFWAETDEWSRWTAVGGDWFYAPALGKFVYVPGGNLSVASGWAYVSA